MGNFLRRSCAVHPACGVEGRRGRQVEEQQQQQRRSSLRIKVRMRRDKFEELLSLASSRGDQSDNGRQIGSLILKECMEGRLPASVIGSNVDVRSLRCGDHLVSRRLGSIAEE